MGNTVRIRFIHAAGLALALGLVAVAPASAAITPTASAPTVAGAMSDSLAGGQLASASFPVIAAPPKSPAATANSPLAGFPTSGSTYSMLSSGDTTLADDPNSATNSGASNGSGDGGHGAEVEDLVTLRLNLNVPASANCLSLDFRFLSEEFPEFVGQTVNDAFVAELDVSDFEGQGNAVTAPHNFAFDEGGNAISVNTAGFSAANAAGTTYDGATSLLRASTPVTAGAHTVYLSVFDQGDSAYDSAAFLDRVVLTNTPPSVCTAGASSDTTPPQTAITAGPGQGGTSGPNPAFSFAASEPGSVFQCRLDGAAFANCTSPISYTGLANGPHTFSVRAFDPAGNPDPTPASRTFTVAGGTGNDTTPPQTTIVGGPAEGSAGGSNPSFSFASSEAGSAFECSMDGAPFGGCTSPTSYADLVDGPHAFAVRAIDASGNVDSTPATRSFTVGDDQTGGKLPSPVAGESVNVAVVSGSVRARCNGDGGFREVTGAEHLAVGCTVDATRGRVRLTSETDASGVTQTADFYLGEFKIKQAPGESEVTLKLTGDLGCGKGGKDRGHARRGGRRRGGRGLWGDGDGRFSTRGHHGAGTVRGTKWFVGDRCDGSTYIKVARGVVSFRDFVADKTVEVRAGQRYSTE